MYKLEIESGMAWLTEHWPGWRERIDRTRLDMGSIYWCILGQVFAEEEGEGSGFMKAMNWFQGTMDPWRCGFLVDTALNYRQLTREWLVALEALAEGEAP